MKSDEMKIIVLSVRSPKVRSSERLDHGGKLVLANYLTLKVNHLHFLIVKIFYSGHQYSVY